MVDSQSNMKTNIPLLHPRRVDVKHADQSYEKKEETLLNALTILKYVCLLLWVIQKLVFICTVRY